MSKQATWTVPDYSQRPVFLAALLTLLVPCPALAQTSPNPAARRVWTLEVYGGGSASTESTNGTPLTGFPDGTPFTTEADFPSRQQFSWYFGDGAGMLNDVIAQFAQIDGSSFARIVPLDDALLANGLHRRSGTTVGVRVGRSLSSRLALEASVERSQGRLAFTNAMRTALETSSDSFEAAFQDMLETAPVTNLSVASALTVPEGSNHQTRIAGSLTWTPVRRDRLRAYATAGAGVVISGGDIPEARLRGAYDFRLYGSFPISETDRTTVRVKVPGSAAMGLIGSGVTYDLSPRVGLRVDVRLSLSANRTVTTITGAPDVTPAAQGAFLPSSTSPGVQFSSLAHIASSLSAPLTTLTTFTGSGLNRHVSFTIGLFRRF